MKIIAWSVFISISCCRLWAATLYVDLNNAASSAPFDSWATAATTIQAAVDAAVAGDTVRIADGHYLLSSEISVTNAVTIQSENGPEFTIVDGRGIVRCFNLGSTACVIEGLTITNGYTMGDGGGIYCSGTTPIVTNCILSGNSAISGGGMYNGTANNCTISGNSAQYGGGMIRGTANNCAISGNSAFVGGGTSHGTANNCTISGNLAYRRGGGINTGTANNCIVRYNESPNGNDLYSTTARFSCSRDLRHGVDGNITNAPILLSSSHIAPNSPCRGAGRAAYSSGTDVDGEVWLNPPSMGCDEYHGCVTGALQVAIDCSANVVAGYPLSIHGQIEGALDRNGWDFGDGTRVTNSYLINHTWSSPGTYELILTAYNDTWPSGVSATQMIHVARAERTSIHVSGNGNDVNDGASWALAKATIQAGIDAQQYAGGWVWVSNATYAVTNEILVNKEVIIKSVNGPESTIVDGQGIVRCFNLGSTACVIEGLTITNGYTTAGGGGIYCTGITPVVTNCTLSGNSADDSGGGMFYGTANNCIISGNSAIYGGGIHSGTAINCIISANSADDGGGGMRLGKANNCMISGNSAGYSGGGMEWGAVNNCTLSGNSAARFGGGIYSGTANNCIVWYNESPDGNDLYATTALYSCSPDGIHGIDGNMTNAPGFIDAGAGDYRLMSNSPCINWGDTAYVSGTLDLDGQPRIVGDYVDMGAYEYQGPMPFDQDEDGLPDDWERTMFGFNADPEGNADSDVLKNYEEYVAGSDPTNSESVFSMSVATNYVPESGFVVEWPVVTGRWYQVFWSPGLTNRFESLRDHIEYPQNSYTDTVHDAESSGFYQVEVQLK